ncbi:MAG: hypothetical protein ACTSPG_09365 [Candidatus Hodarchaeales archaeon]
MELKEADLILKPVQCQTGMEPICVLDPEHPCCENVPREVIKFEHGEMVRQGNSAIVSLKLRFNDPVEEFIFDRIRNELFREPGSKVKVIRQPEEGFSISFFLNTEMVKTKDQREALIKYWSEFETKTRQVLTDGKMVFNKFVRARAEYCRLK